MTEEVAETIVTATTPQTMFAVKDFIDAAELKRDLAFTPNNLTDAMMTQASMFSHYGVLASQASRQVDVVKMLLESTEATVYKIIRDEMASKGEKVTETMLEKQISRHSRVVAMKKALNEAKRVESVSKIAVESFRHRRDMLVQMGLISREEMKGDLRILERSVREEAEIAQRQGVLERLKNRPRD